MIVCRFCGAALTHTFVDLGCSPLANALLTQDRLEAMEPHYPLHVRVCEHCLLVQLPELATAQEIFDDYPYLSSYSDTWRRHCAAFAEGMTQRLELGRDSLVVEIASNDGTLLREFQRHGVGVLGVEPAANVARIAEAAGVPTDVAYFSEATARRMVAADEGADLICANNVLAHVPALNDFVAGLALLLKSGGTITVEFPHLLRLIKQRQFDTIYHEHFSYFSLLTAQRIFAHHGLCVVDVETLPIHGGSLRLYVRHDGEPSARVEAVLAEERSAGLDDLRGYAGFAEAVADVKCAVLDFLVQARRAGHVVAGYGAPAKASTLLNTCGVGPELLRFTVDRSPHKQGRFVPGVRIPILPPEHVFAAKPDYLLILPWNIADEVMTQMARVREWGCRFVTAIPELRIV
jgi:SAM-dependent methyltransferase